MCRASEEHCIECGRKAIWLIFSENEVFGPFCEDCSLEFVFDYSGLRRENIKEVR